MRTAGCSQTTMVDDVEDKHRRGGAQFMAPKLGRERQVILEFLQVRRKPGDTPSGGLVDDSNRCLECGFRTEPRILFGFIGSEYDIYRPRKTDECDITRKIIVIEKRVGPRAQGGFQGR